MKNSFACRRLLAIIGFLAMGMPVKSQVFAKGLDKLAPASEAPTPDDTGEAQGEDGNKGAGKIDAESTATAPTGAYQIATSYGWAALSKSSNSWHANGMSDLAIFYRLPMKVIGDAIYASFRYAPMAVAPVIKDGGENYAYTGVVTGYHFGANVPFKLKEKLTVCGSAELGLMSASLVDALGLPSHKVPDDSGVDLTVGGGADWHFLPGFDVGSRIYLGLGSFTSFQVGVSGTFSF